VTEAVWRTRMSALEWCRRIVASPQPEREKQLKAEVEPRLTRYDALPAAQQHLKRALLRFMGLTLAISVLAIVFLVFADVLSAHAWTAWMLKRFVILASLGLGAGPFYLVYEAACYIEVWSRFAGKLRTEKPCPPPPQASSPPCGSRA
jgi:hypothetical protein